MSIVEDKIKNESGEEVTIYIEVDDRAGSYDPFHHTRGVGEQAKEAFKQSMGLIHLCAENIAQTVRAVPAKMRPREFEVQFSIKIDAELGAILAKSRTEAQLQVTLKWGSEEKA